MKNLNDSSSPVKEPTEEEIIETIERFNTKYDIVIRRNDGVELAKLIKELAWWLEVERENNKPDAYNDREVNELIDEVWKKLGKDISGKDTGKKLKLSVEYAATVQKKKILERMKEIVDKYR